MSGLGFGDTYRKYYVNHATSVDHQEKYLIPLDNQYSILNKSRNPYAALDHFSSGIHQKSLAKNDSYLRQLQKESLDLELITWQKRQQERENDLRLVRSEVRGLQGLTRLKELESELHQLSQTHKSPKSTKIPFPMLVPIFSPIQNSCCCRCNCAFNCQNRCYLPQKFMPIMTENPIVETNPQSVPNNDKLVSVRSFKAVKLPTAEKIPNKKINKPPARMSAQKRKALLRKFRICSIAVYFAIYFKWFAFQFSVNRYNNFKNKYLLDNAKTITEDYKQIYTQFLKIDIPRLIKAAAQKIPTGKPTQLFDISTLLKSQAAVKFKKLGQLTILSNNSETLFMRCGQFLLSLLDEVQQKINEWQWGEVGFGLGVGCLNQSFVIDNVFLPHEIYLMVFHDGKGYARVTPEAEKILTMTKFIIKLLIYNVCLQLDNNKEWFQMYEKQLKQKEDLQELFIFLQISSKILFILCQNMYESSLQHHDPNYEQVDSKFQIKPCNPLVYSHSIKRRREIFNQQDLKDSNLLIYGIERLDQVNGFINQTFFKQIGKRIRSKLNQTIDSIHQKLREFNIQKYEQIWEETVSNEYIVLRGLKKVMCSTRYYPFKSTSVLASKSNLQSNKTITKKTIQRDSQKTSSINTKISLENNLRRNRK